MKNALTLLAAILLFLTDSKAQWTTSGSTVNLITGTNNVGIGTSSTSYKLEVLGTTNSTMLLRNSTASSYTNLQLYGSLNSYSNSLRITYASSGSGAVLTGGPTGEHATIGNVGNFPLVFGTLGVARMAITGAGNVGIGTNTAIDRLEVWGTTANNITAAVGTDVQTGFRASKYGVITTDWKLSVPQGSADFRFNNPNFGDVLSMTASGRVGIGTTTPVSKLDISLSSAITSFGSITGSDLGLVLRNSSSTNNNFDAISFADAGGYGVAHVGAILSDHTNHYGKLYFATKGSGSLTQRMVIDDVGNVGINKLAPDPLYRLDVNGPINATGVFVNGAAIGGGGSSQWTTSGTNAYFGLAGNVGIGTSTPASRLEVNGTIRVTPGNYNYLAVGAYNPSTDNFAYISSGGQSNGTGLKFETTNGSGTMLGATRMVITNTGNVGIGSLNPDHKLCVNGTIHASEVLVDTNVPGPDYVFDKHYNLLTLDEVKAYIDKNQHLPEVPSAAEMEKNGVNVGEMNMLLLKKVEELTLHLIQLKEENTSLGARVKALEKPSTSDPRK